jgi:hypothetical protein
MWTWDQSAGLMTGASGDTFSGYAGAGDGKNNPDAQNEQNVGPVPRGDWTIGAPYDSEHTGPYTLALTPEPDTDTCGRSDFRIHGDSIANPGQASHGCIILPRAAREAVWNSGDRNLKVIA